MKKSSCKRIIKEKINKKIEEDYAGKLKEKQDQKF